MLRYRQQHCRWHQNNAEQALSHSKSSAYANGYHKNAVTAFDK